MNPFLSIQHLSYAYHSLNGETKALDDISLDIDKGEFISIVGPSGCGKSTLLSLISGLLAPSQGDLYIDNKKITGHNTLIGYMLQKDHLFQWRTVFKNITLGLEIKNQMTKENLERIDEMLKIYGLYEFRNAYPSQLSGGMRQRVALIRTLALNPQLLLLDEPFSALDYQTRLEVADDIGSIIKKEQKTAILVTHDISEAVSLADRVVILTKRPGTIKKIIPICLSIDKRSSLTSRSAKEFGFYFNEIWKEMTKHGEAEHVQGARAFSEGS